MTGRAANVNDLECAPAAIDGDAVADRRQRDARTRQRRRRRSSGLGAGQGGGTVELSGVSFTDLTNTATISAGTLTMLLLGRTAGRAGDRAGKRDGSGRHDADTERRGDGAGGEHDADRCGSDPGDGGGEQRDAVHGDARDARQTAAAHAAQAAVYTLASKTVIAPFPADFFGSPYSGSWSLSDVAAGRAGGERASCSSPTRRATARRRRSA